MAATGDYSLIEPALARTLSSLRELTADMEVIICCEGPIWKYSPLVCVGPSLDGCNILVTDKQTDNMGGLFNEGLKNSSGSYCTFLWPGVMVDGLEIARHCQILEEQPEIDCIYTDASKSEPNLESGIHYGWLQCQNLIGLQGSVFRKDALIEIGGFDEAQILQRYPGWDIFVRLSKYHQMLYCKSLAMRSEWTPENYPFSRTYPVSKDAAHRYIVGYRNPADIASRRRIKVVVTGGYWEWVHNQLCFYNYFETERGRKDFSWKPVFDFATREEDIDDCDLVIISRGRHENVPNILDICDKKGIPTLYMIDDNWFTVGEDWPAIYRPLFSPGKPSYEVFLQCLRRCTATLVYSPVLAEYVRPYARKLIRLDINIELGHFASVAQKHKGKKGIAGYVGSPRYSDAAFKGLARFIQDNQDWELLVFGVNVPEELKELHQKGQLRFIPYQNYHNYARILASIRPDILVAPLDDCITSQSKCPNKFLEITAAGAVGIYSGMPPYSSIITQNLNGVIIPREQNNSADYWYHAISAVADDPDKKKDLFSNAYKLVSEYYSTNSRYDDFIEMIKTLLKGSGA